MFSTPALRPPAGAAHARILGVGGYRPSRIVRNDDIAGRIDSSDQWIRERSGIIERRWADPHETVAHMGAAAAGKALAQSGVSAQHIGCVITATSTHFKQLPAVAADIAHRGAPPVPPPSTCPRPAPASPTAWPWPATWCAAAAPNTSCSSAPNGCRT